MNKDYWDECEKRDELRREAMREAEYEAWRSGMNPDDVDRDRIYDDYYSGITDKYDLAEREVNRMRDKK